MRIEDLTKRAGEHPWRPFDILLDNGERIPVTHPENLFILKYGDVVVYSDGREWAFNVSAVSALERPSRRRRRRA